MLVQVKDKSLPLFPEALSASSISTFTKCPQAFKLRYIDRLGGKGLSASLVAGGAFAKGLEVARKAFFVESLPRYHAEARGLEAMVSEYGPFETDKKPDFVRTCEAMVSYFDHYPLGEDWLTPLVLQGKPVVEFTFAFPTEVLHPQTGMPILYRGRCDWIGQAQSGIFVCDEKTTRIHRNRDWKLSGQQIGYMKACELNEIPITGGIIRTTRLGSADIQHDDKIFYKTQWLMDRWWQNLNHTISEIVNCWLTGYWAWNFGESCVMYAGCTYYNLCTYPDVNSSPFRGDFVEVEPYQFTSQEEEEDAIV